VIKLSSSFNLYSHPNILLSTHLKQVAKTSKAILKEKFFSKKELLIDISALIAFAHDFGKSTFFFQEKLLKIKETKIKSKHSQLSAYFGYFLVETFLKETSQLEQNKFLPVISFVVIASHHSNLTDLYNNESFYDKIYSNFDVIKEQLNAIDFSVVLKIYEELLQDFDCFNIHKLFNTFFNEFIECRSIKESQILTKLLDDLQEITKCQSLENYFLIELLFSVLIDADKIVASGASLPPRIEEIPLQIIEDYKQKNFGQPKEKINQMRERAYRTALKKIETFDVRSDKRILDLILPTGCGKTLTSLACALKLREKVKETYGQTFTPRIIYSLPFLSIIDQTSEIIEKILANSQLVEGLEAIPHNLFLKHHHLAEIAFHYKSKDGPRQELPIQQALLLTESWHSEIVITTFVQFFHSLISYRNRSSRKFHNIINSIIILDEIQALPHKYWLLINTMLTYLTKHLHCWVIFLTATKPLIFRPEETNSLIPQPENYFSFFNRMIFRARLTPL